MINELITQWEKHLVSLGYSDNTIRIRVRSVTEYIDTCAITDATQITIDTLTRYRQSIREKGNSPHTMHAKIISIRLFLQYLRDHDLTLTDPTTLVQCPKLQKTLPRDILTEKQINNILKAPRSLRRRAILETLYATGIRLSELVNLDLYDLNIKERTLLIRQGKGKKDRLLPIPKTAITVIHDYIKKFRSRYAKGSTTALFIDNTGNRITANNVRTIMADMRRRHSLRRLHTHMFRHAIATHLVRRGVDIRYVQAFLGHAQLSSTQIYTRVVKEDLRREIDKYHPREKMKE
jgi:site-specific recombinase XerD